MSIDQKEFKDIIEYYDHTRYDYRVGWDDSPTPAVHFGYYDETNRKHADALMNLNRVLAEKAGVKSGDQVLDAGCGKGGSSFWLAINKQVKATGITPVQSQIDDCLQQRKHLKLEDQTSFILADYCKTPFKKESFEVIWACESLCHAKDKALFYQEAYRLLKPGGRLVIAEYLRTSRPLETADETLLASWLNRWAIEDIDTEDEHSSYAAEAGFKNFTAEDVTKNTFVSLRNLYNKSRKWMWLSKLAQVFTIRSKVQHDNMIASVQQYKALQKKLWFYSIIAASKP